MSEVKRVSSEVYRASSYVGKMFNMPLTLILLEDEHLVLKFNTYTVCSAWSPIFIRDVGHEMCRIISSTGNFPKGSPVVSYNEHEKLLTLWINVDNPEGDYSRLISTEPPLEFELFSRELGERIKKLFDSHLLESTEMILSNDYETQHPYDYFFITDALELPIEEVVESLEAFETGITSIDGYYHLYGAYGWMGQFFKPDLPKEFFEEFAVIHDLMAQELEAIEQAVLNSHAVELNQFG